MSWIIAAMLILTAARPALAVFSGDMSPKVRSGDPDYAVGQGAWEAKDWAGVVAAMEKVVARRPHHDNAWSRMGYALRKLGRFDEALVAYNKALTLNPHHRDALEYLGEAYLMLDRLADAREVLGKLAVECKRVALWFSDGDFRDGCGQYKELASHIDDYVTKGKLPERW